MAAGHQVLLMKICSRLFEVMQKKIDNLNNTVQENLVAIRVVKAFVREGMKRPSSCAPTMS